MIWRRLLPVLAIGLFFPALLRAQEEEYKFDPFRPNATDSNKFDKMYEDIEIFRRILDHNLAFLYPTHTSMTFGMVGMQGGMMGSMMGGFGGGMGMQGGMMGGGMGMAGGMMPVVTPLPSLEGVYLKGQGVVYTATLTSLSWTTKTAKVEATKPVSEWESVRRQLHNDKEEPKKPEASKPPTLSDVLLKVLAENGHNFSQLGANESLTIVLTVHQPHSPSPARKARRGGSGSSATTTGTASGSAGTFVRLSEVSDREILGDLHQKQGHYQEAINAFRSAAAREPSPGPNDAARLYRKMAQCYLVLGEDENARKALDLISALRKESADAKDKPAPAAKPAVALPTKLIISVSKKLLGEAKEGKISFEELRSKVHVETLRFDENRSRK